MPDRPAVPALGALCAYVPRGTERCPECGRDWIRTASGKLLCPYAEAHECERPIYVEEARDA